MDVVSHLSKDAGPIDGVDGGQFVFLVRFWVGKESLDHILAVIEGA